MLFNFLTLLLKMYIFVVVTIFSHLVVSQSTQFFCGNTYLQDSRFDKLFFCLTIRIPMAPKLFRVVTWYEKLSPIHIMTSKRSGFLRSRDKKIYLNLQQIY